MKLQYQHAPFSGKPSAFRLSINALVKMLPKESALEIINPLSASVANKNQSYDGNTGT